MMESAFTDQERLRRLIRAELEKHRPRENALAALEVVAETRMRMVIEPELNPEAPQGANGSWRPDAVRRAVEELRRTHPLLFARPTEERLGVADEGSAVARKNPQDETSEALSKPLEEGLRVAKGHMQDEPSEVSKSTEERLGVADVGSAVARNPQDETSEALSKSTEEGLTVAKDNLHYEASGASLKVARDWLFLEPRGGILARPADDGPKLLASARGTLRGPLWSSYRDRVKELRSLARRPRAVRVLRNSAEARRSAAKPYAVGRERPTPPRRHVYAAFAVMLALLGVAWVWPKLGPGETTGGDPAREAKETSSRSEQPANGNRTAADTSRMKLRGIPEVIDTATMRLEGKVVRLFGVEWVRGSQAEELAGYLRGREVECELASTPDRYRCQVGGHDLSRAVLFNGGGRATGDAPPELVEAENNAKAARRGFWQR